MGLALVLAMVVLPVVGGDDAGAGDYGDGDDDGEGVNTLVKSWW